MSQGIFDDDGLRETPEPAPRRALTKKRSRRALWITLGLIAVVLLTGIGVVAYYGKAVNDALSSVNREGDLLPDTSEYTPPPGKAVQPGEERDGVKAPINILIMGTDSRGAGDRGRSDVFMLAHIAGDRNSVHLISIPRDYWVPIPGHGTAKINASYAWGGAPLAVQTVQQLLEVRVDHVAITNFDGFIDAIDAIGGVTVVNDQASGSGGYRFPKGEVTLETGEKALVYVRERKNLAGGDFDRSERQRDVVMAVFDKLTSRGVLTDPGMFRDAITTIGPNFTVDDGLTNSAIIDIAMGLGFEGSSNITSMMAPEAGFGTSIDRQSYVRVDYDELERLGQALRDDEMVEFHSTR